MLCMWCFKHTDQYKWEHVELNKTKWKKNQRNKSEIKKNGNGVCDMVHIVQFICWNYVVAYSKSLHTEFSNDIPKKMNRVENLIALRKKAMGSNTFTPIDQRHPL